MELAEYWNTLSAQCPHREKNEVMSVSIRLIADILSQYSASVVCPQGIKRTSARRHTTIVRTLCMRRMSTWTFVHLDMTDICSLGHDRDIMDIIYALNSKVADQTVHLHRLILVFVVCISKFFQDNANFILEHVKLALQNLKKKDR